MLVRVVAALVAGALLGAGLSVSAMINPAKVLAFLDLGAISEGLWDPSLALVMAGALAVTAAGYALAFRRRAPLLASSFSVPTSRAIDARLLGGASLFGVGWGLVGYCPGPAIAGLGLGLAKTWLFVAAMVAGMLLHRVFVERPGPAPIMGRAAS